MRNTFIDAIGGDEDEDDPLFRTMSDPTGGRPRNVFQLGKISDLGVGGGIQGPVQEGTKAEEAGEEVACL